MEDELAKELQMRKLENESKERFRQKIIQDSQEIQGLKKKIQVAQVNKERTRQMAEQQITKIEDKRIEAQLDENILKKMQEEDRMEQLKQEEIKQKKLQSKYILKDQMQEKIQAAQEAHEQFL